MRERWVLVKAFAAEYRKRGKKQKGAILERFVQASGYVRRYAARLLRNQGRRVVVGPGVWVEGDVRARVRRQRRRIYGEDVQRQLKRIWQMLDYICGKRLVAALPATVEALERHGELKIRPPVRHQLLSMSAATIDRILAPEKRKLALKGRSGTKPGTLLRQQVAVRTFADWDEARPGFVEVDLVAHEGGNAHGEYAQTLNLTDVSTGWIELAAVPNKAQVWVFEALQRLRQQLPFPLLGLDCDNGSEFINHQLRRYCEQQQITLTRSRPLRKNDNCFVEQKNYSVVRRFVGYARYDRETEVQLLNRLYDRVRLYVNFFLPSHKLKEKIRRGSRVHKRYHPAQTPYQRALASQEVSAGSKKKLKAQYQKLNPAELHRQIEDLQDQLLELAGSKQRAGAVEPSALGEAIGRYAK